MGLPYSCVGHSHTAHKARAEPAAVKPRAQLGQTVLVEADEIFPRLDSLEGQETENYGIAFMPHIVFEGATVGDPVCGFATVTAALADKSLRTRLAGFRPTSAFVALASNGTGSAAVPAGAFATFLPLALHLCCCQADLPLPQALSCGVGLGPDSMELTGGPIPGSVLQSDGV